MSIIKDSFEHRVQTIGADLSILFALEGAEAQYDCAQRIVHMAIAAVKVGSGSAKARHLLETVTRVHDVIIQQEAAAERRTTRPNLTVVGGDSVNAGEPA